MIITNLIFLLYLNYCIQRLFPIGALTAEFDIDRFTKWLRPSVISCGLSKKALKLQRLRRHAKVQLTDFTDPFYAANGRGVMSAASGAPSLADLSADQHFRLKYCPDTVTFALAGLQLSTGAKKLATGTISERKNTRRG